MKRLLSFLAVCSLLLSACGNTATSPAPVRRDTLLQNPLFAERYWDDLTDTMVNLLLKKDPSDASIMGVADNIRQDALKHASDATKLRTEGKSGTFVSVKEDVQGWTLLLGQNLFLSSDFNAAPGPSLTLYLTATLDPRDGTFPDKTSVNLGKLESPYGAQTYTLPTSTDTKDLRTVVLFDPQLHYLYGFAQLQ